MTTIAVSRPAMMMASDTQLNSPDMSERGGSKLRRYKNFIAGFSGEVSDISRMAEWLRKRDGRVRLSDASALLLYRDGKITSINEDLIEHEIHEDYYAIGSGRVAAIAAMDVMEMTGDVIDPRLAVRVAARRDPSTGEPIHFLRWRCRST